MKKKAFFRILGRFLSPKFQPQFVLLPSGTSESTKFSLKKEGKSQEFREQEEINDVSKDTRVRDEAGKSRDRSRAFKCAEKEKRKHHKIRKRKTGIHDSVDLTVIQAS